MSFPAVSTAAGFDNWLSVVDVSHSCGLEWAFVQLSCCLSVSLFTQVQLTCAAGVGLGCNGTLQSVRGPWFGMQCSPCHANELYVIAQTDKVQFSVIAYVCYDCKCLFRFKGNQVFNSVSDRTLQSRIYIYYQTTSFIEKIKLCIETNTMN